MENNIYDEIMANMDNLPSETDKKMFLKEFWGTLNKEERLVFTLDALASFERDGLLDTFFKDVNNDIAKKQDNIMDQYINNEISKEEFLQKMSKVKKLKPKKRGVNNDRQGKSSS